MEIKSGFTNSQNNNSIFEIYEILYFINKTYLKILLYFWFKKICK